MTKLTLCVAMLSVRIHGQVFKSFSVAQQNGLARLGGYGVA